MDIRRLDIPASKVNQFNNKGIETIEDLVNFLPRDYYDFRRVTPINRVKDGEICSVVGTVTDIRRGDKYFKLRITDTSSSVMYITFFNQNFAERYFALQKTYHFCGKINYNQDYNTTQMINPPYYSEDLEKYKKIIPIYSKISGMSDDYLMRSINTALAMVDKREYLTMDVLDKYNLLSKKDTIHAIHQPTDFGEVDMAKERLVFDDLFKLASQLALRFDGSTNTTDVKFTKSDTIKPFMSSLPFALTDDQRKTLHDIYNDMYSGRRVNALVQGDVGSGKTIVAFILMLIAAENGYQSTLMVPTNVLAAQHYEELVKIGEEMGYPVAFLTGATKAREKRRILKGLEDGSILMAVGTHALITDDVVYRNLGLSIVDEEHRFGVDQRGKLEKKSKSPVHMVTMSATPIPRSLALTVHGDNVSVYNIIQMPAGRKPIKTEMHQHGISAYSRMREEIKKGRQCYAVCPLIDESNAAVMNGVISVQELFNALTQEFTGENIRVDYIAGTMKKDVIEKKIEQFAQGEIQVLISTTIIEVGVNVPNASVMMIQNAERFGLAQLHQLRGRVGRGKHQSYCIMVSQEENSEKLNAMVETTNGFKIAEVDLRLRGPGDFIGTRQSGDNRFIMLMLAFPKLFQSIRQDVKNLISDKRYAEYFNNVKATL